MFTTQYLTAIPPIIRNNVRLWVVFKFSNSERLLKHVYPEISNLVKEEKFLELYEHATNNDHEFFCWSIIKKVLYPGKFIVVL